MAEVYLGQIIAVPYNFAPVGWQMCDGSLLSIADNDALYSLIGTTYGGDGVSNFAVPDLRSRMMLHTGTGAGLSTYVMGQAGGTESVTLTTSQNALHVHPISAQSGSGGSSTPAGNFLAASGVNQFSASGGSVTGTMLTPAGSSQPHENRMPFLAMYYVIATQGNYPSFS